MDTIKYKFSTIESHAHAQCYDIQPQWKLFAVHRLYSCLKILKIFPTCFKISTVVCYIADVCSIRLSGI